MKLPINLPFLWKIVLNTPGEESGFVDAGNRLLNDLMYDLNNYYLNLDIETCNLFKKHLTRIMTFRYYPNYDSLTTSQQTYLWDNDFMVPDNTILGTYKIKFSGKDVASFSDSFYDPDFYIKKDSSFSVGGGELNLEYNIFSGEDSVNYKIETYITPWGEALQIYVVRLFANEITLEESPLWNNFGSLVYTREIDDTETEEEYRSKILGLFYMGYHGMTETSLNVALNVTFGYPVLLYNNEEILEMTSTKITTNKTSYLIDPSFTLNPDLAVGQKFPKFTPIHNVITIDDGITNPTWANGRILPWYMYYNSDTLSRIVDLTTTYPFTFAGIATSRIRYDTWGAHPFYDNSLKEGDWTVATTYAIDEYMEYNGVLYKSLAGANTGNQPDISPLWWERQETLRTYHYTYYVWEQFFKNTLFSINLNLNLFDLDDIVEMQLFDAVLPIWSAYMITGTTTIEDTLQINEPSQPGSFEEDPLYIGASASAGFGATSYFMDTTTNVFSPEAWNSDRQFPNTFTNVGATVTSVNHGVLEGDAVKLPTGFFGSLEYFRVVAPVAANTFTTDVVPFNNVGPEIGYEVFDSTNDYKRAIPAAVIPPFKFNSVAPDPYWAGGVFPQPSWIEGRRPGMMDGAHILTSDKSVYNLVDLDTATVTCLQDTTSIHGMLIGASNLTLVDYVRFTAAGNFQVTIYSDRIEIDILTGFPAPQAAQVFNFAGGPYASGLFTINLSFETFPPNTTLMQVRVASTQVWDELLAEVFHAEAILNAPAAVATTFTRSGGVIDYVYMDGTYI